MSGYLGRVATQLAGGGVAPKPTLRTSSPIAKHDQLPMVEGLEAAPPPAFTEVQSFDAPAEDSLGIPVSTRAGAPIESEQDRPAVPRPPTPFAIEVDRERKRVGEDARLERPVVDDTGSRRVATPTTSRTIAVPADPPSPDAPALRRPGSALDLMQVLGRVSQDIASANRATAQPESLRPREPEPAFPETSRSSPPQLIPAPIREAPAAVAPSTTSESPAAPKVQIGELRIEVVQDAPRNSTRRSTRAAQAAAPPGRGPIGSRPSKRRFAAGRG